MSTQDYYDVNWDNFKLIFTAHLTGRFDSEADVSIYESEENYIVKWDEKDGPKHLSPINKKWLLSLKPEPKKGLFGTYMTSPRNELRKKIRTNAYGNYIEQIIHFFSKKNPNIESIIERVN